MTTCKVCSNTYEGVKCPSCGFVDIVLPEAAPQAVKDAVAARIKYIKEQYSMSQQAPVVEAPVVESPAVEAPVVETPVVESPAVEAPVVVTPAVVTPVIETPAVEIPVVETPVVEAPAVEAPVVETPSVQDTQPSLPTVSQPVDADLPVVADDSLLKRVTWLEETNQKLLSEIDLLKTEIAMLKAVKSTPSAQKLIGIVELYNNKTGDRSILPIFAGRMSYGAGETSAVLMHLDINVFSFSMPDRLFEIVTSDVYPWAIRNTSSVPMFTSSGVPITTQGVNVSDASQIWINHELKLEIFEVK